MRKCILPLIKQLFSHKFYKDEIYFHIYYFEWGKEAESVWEYGVEENIWTKEGRGNGGMEETA